MVPPTGRGILSQVFITGLQDPSGAYPETTGVTETADRLYIQNLHAKGIGRMPK